MASVFDVATYILEKSGEMSTMKLQKLCYYSQAWSLVWDEEPLFQEEFQAWANGPVCRDLFLVSKGKYSVTSSCYQGDVSELSKTQKETVDKVLEHYGHQNAQWLSQLTHLEDPWKNSRKDLGGCERSEAVITQESMAMYYASL